MQAAFSIQILVMDLGGNGEPTCVTLVRTELNKMVPK